MRIGPIILIPIRIRPSAIIYTLGFAALILTVSVAITAALYALGYGH